jgi:hypothetical protein
MAIDSWGWDGSVDEAQWASLSSLVGADSAFRDDADFKPRAGTSTRTTILGVPSGRPALAVSSGVAVTSDAEITLTHTDPPTGQSRWDAVVIRRDWSGVGGTPTVMVVEGTAGSPGPKTLPVLESTPGDVEDQLVAWVQITQAQAQPTAVEDLRLRTSPVIMAPSLTAIRNPRLGSEAVLPDGRRWRFELINGVAQWRGDRSIMSPLSSTMLQSTQAFLPKGPNWIGTNLGQQIIPVSSNAVFVNVNLTYRGTSPIVADDANGNMADVELGSFVAPYRPNHPQDHISGVITTRRGSPTAGEASTSGFFYIGGDGKLVLTSGMPGMDIYQRAIGLVSARVSALIVSNNPFFPNS